MAKKNIGATLSLKDGNFFANLKKASSATDEFKKKLGLAANALKSHGKAADTVGTSLKSLAGKAAGVVASFVSIQKAISFGKDIVNTGLEFEQGMANVSAISGATGAELTALREKAKEMGATTKYSAIEASDAMSYMAMAGWSSSQMIDGISGVMNLAAASGEELGSVSDIVTDALTAFGLKASDSADFADILAMACAKSNTNVAMLGEAFKNVAPTAGAMGYNVRDTTVALGLMASAGIKGGAAGTSLNGVLTRLAKPTKEVSAAMSALGLSAVNADGSMKPLSQFIPELQAKFSTLTAAQKGQYATMIAGKNAMSGFLALVNSSPSDFQSLTDAINNSSGAAQNMADTMNDTVSGKLTLLKSQFEGVKIAIYDALGSSQFKGVLQSMSDGLSAITPYVTTLTVAIGNGIFSAINKISNAASTVFTAVKTAVESSKPSFDSIIDSCIRIKDAVAGMFSGDAGGSAERFINGTIPMAVSAFASIMDKIADVTSFISAHKNIFEPLTAGILGAVAAFKLISGVSKVVSIISELGGIVGIVKGLGGMLLGVLGPAGWAIVGIAAAVTAIAVVVYKNWDKIKAAAVSLGNKIKDVFGGIKTAVSNAWNGIKDKAGSAWDGIKNVVSQKLNNIKNAYSEHGGGLKGTAAAVMTGIKEYYKTGYDAINALTGGRLGQVVDSVKAKLAPMVNAVKEKLNGVKEAFGNAFSGAIDFIKTSYNEGALKPIVDRVVNAFGTAKDAIAEKFNGIKEAVGERLTAIGDAAESVKNTIAEKFTSAKDAAVNKIGEIRTGIQTVLEPVRAVISTALGGVRDIAVTVFNGIKTHIMNVFNAAKTTVMNIVSGIKANFQEFFGTIKTVFENIRSAAGSAFEGVKTMFKGMFQIIVGIFTLNINSIKTGVQTVTQGIGQYINNLKMVFINVWTAITASATLYFNNIKTVISNVIEGIKTTVGSIKTTFSNVFSSIQTTVSSVFTSIKSTISNVWNSIKSLIKAPHIVQTGTISIAGIDTAIPKLGIEWYAKGGILNSPTLFGFNGSNAMVGGEAGAEAIVPLAELWSRLGDFANKVSEQKAEEAKPSVIEKIIINVNGSDMSADDVVNELMPKLKLAIANM